jgi:MFS family permease
LWPTSGAEPRDPGPGGEDANPGTLCGTSRRVAKQRSPLVILFLTVFIDLLGFGIVLPLLPQYAKDYDAGRGMLALIMASFSAMQFLFAPLWGRLSDRHGRRPILLIGLMGSTFSYMLFGLAEYPGFATGLGFADPVPVLLISRILAGIFGATIGTAYAYIADVTDSETRGKGMALIGAAFGIGFTVGPAVGGLSDQYIGSAAPGFIASGLSFAALLYAWRRLPEPEKHRGEQRRGWLAFRALRKALSAPGVTLVIALQFLSTFAFANLEGTLALFAEATLGYDTGQNGWLFAYLGFTLLIAQGVIVRRLLPKVGEINFIVAGALILGVGLGGVALSTETWHAMVALPVGVLGSAMLTTALASLLSQRTPEDMQGEVLGVGQSALSLARICGPAAGNLLLIPGMMYLPFVTGAAVMVIGFLMAVLLWLRPASQSA